MRRSVIVALELVLALAGAAAAQAQAPPIRFELAPAAGAMLFASDLPSEFQLTSEFGDALTLSGVEIDPALAVGGRVGVRVGERFGIGASLLYSPLTYSTSTAAEQDGDLYTYGADVSYHATGLSERVAPFVIAGVGAKSYGFDGADTETDLMWNAGLGVDVGLSPNLALRLEARDYMSMFDPAVDGLDEELQHDIGLSAGLSFSFGPPDRHASASHGGPRRR